MPTLYREWIKFSYIFIVYDKGLGLGGVVVVWRML